jgi:DNA-binding transcriptional ArsR family regulator
MGGTIFEAAAEWRASAADEAPDLLAASDAWNSETWSSLFGLALDNGPDLGATALIDLARVLDPIELRLRALGYYRRWVRIAVRAEVIESAAHGDDAALAELRRRAFPADPSWPTTIDRLKAESPEITRDALADSLERWFELMIRARQAALDSSAEAERERWLTLAGTMNADAVIEEATGGIVYIPDVGSRTSVLIPSVFTRPITQIVDHRDTTILICPSQVDDRGAASNAPPNRLMKMTKALSDETRMRVLLVLRERPRTAKEIAAAVGIPRTSIFHHMIILRAAGLIRTIQPGFGAATYAPRETALAELSTLLSSYLGGDASAAAGDDEER